MQVTQHSKQTVPAAIITNWRATLQQADKVAIAILYGYPIQEVDEAFAGTAEPDLIRDINHYCGLTE